ncbi:hypothetical protein GCM10028807_04030 [Spirosoma daeguense]
MKQKIDETPDEWVRQTLSRLPDTPPPGSSFDSERLWSQLRPELQAKKPRRRLGWLEWGAAACLTGFLLSWMFWQQPVKKQRSVATYQHKSKKTSRVQAPDLTTETTTSAPIHVAKLQQNPPRENTNHQPITPAKPVNVASESTATTDLSRPEVSISRERGIQIPSTPLATFPEPQPIPDVVASTEKLPEVHKPNVATATSKRRFKVVHENELRAEEESTPQLYRTDNFVRLGTGQRSDNTATDTHQPGLVMPLTSKSNQ